MRIEQVQHNSRIKARNCFLYLFKRSYPSQNSKIKIISADETSMRKQWPDNKQTQISHPKDQLRNNQISKKYTEKKKKDSLMESGLAK